MLDKITPLILTYNEAPNIGRTLEQLRWARDIVVVDSFSDDDTVKIISTFPQARVFQRGFDTHERQWNFGLKETGIASEWVIALDADFVTSPKLIEEINRLEPTDDTMGYRARFVFCISGRRIRSAVCPPVTFLYRREAAEYFQDGHTQKLKLDGRIEPLSAPIFHDDRKPLLRWLKSQHHYATLEAQKLLSMSVASLDQMDRIRRLRIIAPFAMWFYCLIIRGGIFDGRAGWLYACHRLMFEFMLSVCLLKHDLHINKPATARIDKKLIANTDSQSYALPVRRQR